MSMRSRTIASGCGGLRVLLAVLLVGCTSGESVEDDLPTDVTDPGTPLFSFETSNSLVAQALTATMRGVLARPTTEAAYHENRQSLQMARDTLQANAADAVAVLQAELDGRPEADQMAWSLAMHLLADTRSDAAADFFVEQALRTLPDPDPTAEEGVEFGAYPRDHVRLLRRQAVSQLRRMAGQGSAHARVRLLDVVAAADDDVQVTAVAAYYQVSPARWLAKKELAARLPASKRYLVHAIF